MSGFRFEGKTAGAGDSLILVDGELADETGAVIAQAPLAIFEACGAGQRATAEDQKIAPTAQEALHI